MHRILRRSAASITLAIALSVLASCSTSWKAPETPFRGYRSSERSVDLGVVLELGPELLEAKWEQKGGLEMFVGRALANNAEMLARHVFREVIVVDAARMSRPVATTLTPRVAYIGLALGACGPCDSILSIRMEWRLIKPDGQPIWIETVAGQAKGRFARNEETLFGRAIDDLFLQSERAMVESGAIRLAATRR